MFEILDRRASLTGNQFRSSRGHHRRRLEFFDYFLIGFVLAFLMGMEADLRPVRRRADELRHRRHHGRLCLGWLADRIGRRKVFIGTVLNFSIATAFLYFTPDNGWIYLSVMRFFVGLGVGGLYCVDLPLVQEFMPSSKRGWVGGIVPVSSRWASASAR